MNKKIVLLGGTFDPIHNTHINIAKQASLALDAEVWFLIAKNPRWKEKITPSRLRLKMLKKALQEHENMHVCDIEIKRPGQSKTYTIDTILELTTLYPKYDFYYLVGSDQVNKIDNWKDIDVLSKLVKLVLINRPGFELNKQNIKKYKIKDIGLVGDEVSSTNIRQGNYSSTPASVQEIIHNEGIYLDLLIKNDLSEARYKHSVSVAKLAKKIAKANNYDVNKAYIAGLVHDCAKELPKDVAFKMMQQYEPKHIHEPIQLYHQYLAPIIAKERYGIIDEEILDAIKYHATACKNISTLGKIIYCADKADPTRDYDSSFLIERCLENIDLGFAYVIEDNVYYLQKVKHNVFINEDTKYLYNKALELKLKFMVKLVAKTLDDKFAYNICVIDVSDINPLAQYYINCDAGSDRQLRAIGDSVEEILTKYQYKIHHIEGQNDTGWVLVDAVDVVVNIFKASKREEYKLEKIWSEHPQYGIEEILEWEITF